MNWTGGRKSKVNINLEKQKQRQHFQKIRRQDLSLSKLSHQYAHLVDTESSASRRSSRYCHGKKKEQSESLSLKAPQSEVMAVLPSASLQSLEMDAQNESWLPFHGICIEDIGVNVEQDPFVRDVFHKTVVDHAKFQKARRYCSKVLSNGVFDWHGREYQLRHLSQGDLATMVTQSISDDDSDHSFDGTCSSNCTSGASNRRTSMQENDKAYMDERPPDYEQHPPTTEENQNARDAKEVEVNEEDEDEPMIPVKHLANCQKARELLTTHKKYEETKAEERAFANIHLERLVELDDAAPENTTEITSEILSWTRSTVSEDMPYPGQQPATSSISVRSQQYSSPPFPPVNNVYTGPTQEQLDTLFENTVPLHSPKSFLGSDDWLELGSNVE